MNSLKCLVLVTICAASSILTLSYPQEANAQNCQLPNSHYRLIPVRTNGPFVRTDGKVYQGSYQGGEIRLCNGRKIKPRSECQEAYQWRTGDYNYQINLICNADNYEAKLIIYQKGKTILDEGLYHLGRAN